MRAPALVYAEASAFSSRNARGYNAQDFGTTGFDYLLQRQDLPHIALQEVNINTGHGNGQKGYGLSLIHI